MGTRGFCGYRRRGRYMFVKNSLDSYPEWLGQDLVEGIPKEKDAFQKWKASREKWFDDLLKHYLKRDIIHPTKFEILNVSASSATETEDLIEDATEDSIEYNHELQWIWSSFPPDNQHWSYDAQWTYIFDLDRDALTINSNLHFRLSNMPADWLANVDLDHTAVQCMPTSVDAALLAWDVFPNVPVLNRDLLQTYHEIDVKIIDAPTPSGHVKNWIIAQMREWTLWDRRMQTWVYALLKCCVLEGLSFEFPPRNPFGRSSRTPEDGLNSLLKAATVPEQPEYLIPVSSGNKVLVSLATHLEIEDIVKTAITKVVDLVPGGSSQTACIVSPREVIIVRVDKYSTRVSVSHTKLLALEGKLSPGCRALVATLSPPLSRLDNAPQNGNLPGELMEMIFKTLLLDVGGGFRTVPELACTCKMFSAMVHDYTVHLPGLLFYTCPPWLLPNFYRCWDISSDNDRLYCMGQLMKVADMRSYKVFVDGANLGPVKLTVAPIDVIRFERVLDSFNFEQLALES